MKPAKIYNCQTCRETGYVQSSFKTACAVVSSDALPNKQWTPAQVGRALKIVLYVGMAAAVWALNHYLGGKTTVEDILEGQDTPRPATTNDFSPWEPAP